MLTPVPDFPAVLMVTGALYALLGLAGWTLLHRYHPALPAGLWSLGGLGVGTGVVLVARQPAAGALAFAMCLLYAGLLMRITALRCDLHRQPQPGRSALLWLALSAGQWICNAAPDAAWGDTYAALAACAGTAAIASLARNAARRTGSRSALMLAWTEGLLSAMLALCALLALMAAGVTAPGIASAWPLLAVVAIGAAMYGPLGYIGMVLDCARADGLRAREAQWAESTRREAAEQQANDLQDLLHQRDRLAAERQQLLQVLAHEIRQPLHSASGALQAAAGVLQSPPGEHSQSLAAQRLQRAQSVLGEVQSVLDNTLAAATLLSRQEPLSRQDVDVDFLIDLALGDLGDAQRSRVRTDWQASLRSVEVEPGLARLALRNLLRNAFDHGGRDVRVTLRIQEQPGALVLSVIDSGGGMSPARLKAAVELPDPDLGPLASGGLGLYIVRRVMALHGGRVVLGHNTPQGLIVQLVFPQLRVTPSGQLAAAGIG